MLFTCSFLSLYAIILILIVLTTGHSGLRDIRRDEPIICSHFQTKEMWQIVATSGLEACP